MAPKWWQQTTKLNDFAFFFSTILSKDSITMKVAWLFQSEKQLFNSWGCWFWTKLYLISNPSLGNLTTHFAILISKGITTYFTKYVPVIVWGLWTKLQGVIHFLFLDTSASFWLVFSPTCHFQIMFCSISLTRNQDSVWVYLFYQHLICWIILPFSK